MTIFVTLYFMADFTILGGTNNDYISSVYSSGARCYAGSCSGAALQIVQQREANGLPALAQATTNFASFYPVTSRTFLLNLSVGNNAYWMSESN